MRRITALVVVLCLLTICSQAQYGRMRTYPRRRTVFNETPFKPSFSISAGYTYPNLDKQMLAQFYSFYQGNASQTASWYGSADYQYNAGGSIGVMVTHGKVTAPYYSNVNMTSPEFTGSLESWGILLNTQRFMQGSKVIKPYIRTAIGVNLWTQHYLDNNGNELPVQKPNMLAYQAGIGAQFMASKHTGLFVEAGYGKYILNAGLTFKL